ncbi:Salicylate biosynthesis isochorismate synthase [Pelotomaculum schinkii]|uniref:isochorismate synthase n=1 Tax=Pelotomaculum schinkii TaxID=78350 RepID=A0A4Y7R8M5_9FIRM|nr:MULTISPECIES: isochorismate synthase [Pelotomaculum]TEB05318.1 Salicylate biosynthesis isochorismate synthase [Pelotomaculum schinkii]TEB17357.1 Salicylate biosynthesis isochorismate synthase [Pelotomaculum sp. FP]
MKYQKTEVKLDNSLSFWKHFDKEERVLFYNPLNNELIIGAKRLKTFGQEENYNNYLYVFSSRTFFDSVKDQKWAEFGNETVAFEYYLVEKKGKQTLYYFEDLVEIENLKIKSNEHFYNISADDYEEWKELFANVYYEISSRKVNKVVISREVKIVCETLVNTESVLKNLLEKNQNSFIFAYFKNGKTFLGATPEILVQKEKDNIISYALAGTILRNDEDDELQKMMLLNDRKNRYEHQIVIDKIADVMKQYIRDVIIDEIKILTLKNLHHLQTRIYGKDNSTLSEWVTRLHPTPALGGNPAYKALEIIKKYEKHERGLYAAPIGIMDENGDGIFVAGIRSALICKNMVFAYTGGGIVDKSECEAEYIETNNKLKTIIESL